MNALIALDWNWAAIPRDLLMNLVAGVLGGGIVSWVLAARSRRRWGPTVARELTGARGELMLWTRRYARAHGLALADHPVGTRPSDIARALPRHFWDEAQIPVIRRRTAEGLTALDGLESSHLRIPDEARSPQLSPAIEALRVELLIYGDCLNEVAAKLERGQPLDDRLRCDTLAAQARVPAALEGLWTVMHDKSLRAA
jgi:hypothetical protein